MLETIEISNGYNGIQVKSSTCAALIYSNLNEPMSTAHTIRAGAFVGLVCVLRKREREWANKGDFCENRAIQTDVYSLDSNIYIHVNHSSSCGQIEMPKTTTLDGLRGDRSDTRTRQNEFHFVGILPSRLFHQCLSKRRVWWRSQSIFTFYFWPFAFHTRSVASTCLSKYAKRFVVCSKRMQTKQWRFGSKRERGAWAEGGRGSKLRALDPGEAEGVAGATQVLTKKSLSRIF